MTPGWLDRTLTRCACCYTLCTQHKQLLKLLQQMKVSAHIDTTMGSADARTFLIQKGDADITAPVAVVYIPPPQSLQTPIQVASLLVHEAVHVWQYHARLIGSFNDHGDEEEAYAIQSIAQSLFYEYCRQHGLSV